MTSQQFLLHDSSTLTNFKSWAKPISDFLTACGWAKTSDTGQVDWTSIASVPAAGSFVYEVWKPTDALQTGASQFFMRINYGKTGNAQAGPRIQFIIGTGTDGAGNLTGLTTTGSLTNAWDPFFTDGGGLGGNSSVTFDCYFSGDTDRFSLMMYRSGPSVSLCRSFVFGVERTKNADGSNNAEGVTAVMFNTNTRSRGQQTHVFGVGISSAGATIPDGAVYCFAGLDGVNTSLAFNNNIPIAPLLPQYGKLGNPMTTFAAVHQQDIAEACFFTTTMYGATRTYIAAQPGYSANLSGFSTSRLCMRYD